MITKFVQNIMLIKKKKLKSLLFLLHNSSFLLNFCFAQPLRDGFQSADYYKYNEGGVLVLLPI